MPVFMLLIKKEKFDFLMWFEINCISASQLENQSDDNE